MKTFSTLLASLMLLPATPLMADIIPPIGLAPGSQYQLIFVTRDSTFPASSDINYWNTFVQNEASLSSSLPTGVTWNAVVSTVNGNAASNAPSSGLPVYNTQGILVSNSSIPSAQNSLYAASPSNPVRFNRKLWMRT